MLPEGWKEERLDELLKNKTITVHIDGNHGSFYPKKEEFVSSGVPYISANCIQNGRIDFQKCKFLAPEKADKLQKGIAKDGDVLFAHNATVGPVALLKTSEERVILSTTLTLYRCDPIKLNNSFLYQYMSSTYIDTQYESIMRQTTRNQVPITAQREFVFLLPPLPEQKKIAAILSTWDRAIEGTEKLLANSQQQKKALMQQLLTGKKRLPGFTGEWKKHRLSDFFVRLMQRNTSGNTNVVTISAQDGLVKQEEYFKKTVASETLDGYFLLENGDFAYNKSYSIGYPMGAIKRLNRYEKGVVTTLYICFRLKSHQFANGDFFEFYFDSGLMNYGLTQIAHEGGRAHGLLNVKPADFMHLQVTVPAVDEQEAIAAVLTRANEEITALESDLARLRQEKKALMQQLLTGKRRVTVD
ncbi:restriction endonuclease subunit S (plasmid) [Acetobacter ascendens]|uniref:Restriction endonuclease subunit S n=2 Tax=Acetobacter TaxID=434 RepID=A0A1D8R083_9PROT|nr:restriction endonuclease subunit S [Acetobacter ascendens]AOW47992.1 restriction endonuclease subunit S [Acetobacter ascendens]